MPESNSPTNNALNVQSIVLDKLLDDPQTQEVVVMEYERFSPRELVKTLRLKSKQQGHCLMPNWLALLLANLFLVLLFGLMTGAIMTSRDPPGKAKTITADPLKYNQPYNTPCFTWDDSCDKSKNLWCVNDRCQCYDQLTYWNGSKCVSCPSGFYYDGSTCVCPSYSYLQISASNSCQIYRNYSQSCTTFLCNPQTGVVCNGSRCVCPTNYYYNLTSNVNSASGYCVPYSSNTEKCNTTSQCTPSTSLACINGTCQCPTSGTWFWTGTQCSQISSYNGTCIYDQECDGTLELICNNSKCVCAGVTPYGTWFWNGTQCVLCPIGWLNYEIYCYYNSQAAATWNNSRAYCQKFGADLLVIRNQAEFNFIKPNAAAIIGSRKRAYIGYYTISNTTPGVFGWLDPSLPNFTGSHVSQPWWCGPQPTFSKSSSYTPSVQGCGALQLDGSDICMNDWWFSDLLPFICKKSQ